MSDIILPGNLADKQGCELPHFPMVQCGSMFDRVWTQTHLLTIMLVVLPHKLSWNWFLMGFHVRLRTFGCVSESGGFSCDLPIRKNNDKSLHSGIAQFSDLSIWRFPKMRVPQVTMGFNTKSWSSMTTG